MVTITSAVVSGILGQEVSVSVESVSKAGWEWASSPLLVDAERRSRACVRYAIDLSEITGGAFKWPHGIRVRIRHRQHIPPDQSAMFDLPIAIGVLACAGFYLGARPDACLMVGEFDYSGHLRPIRGAVCVADLARSAGYKSVIVPWQNEAEARKVEGIEVVGAKTLADVVAYLTGLTEHSSQPVEVDGRSGAILRDMSEVRGHDHAKRGLEIAVAGGHNVLMVGQTGCGKVMLAQRVVTLMPQMTFDEAHETSKVYSVAGLGGQLPTARPFRAPHHTISEPGLVGNHRRPGEVSLAHNGVLLLDELPEFRRASLNVLVDPLRNGVVTHGHVWFPSAAMLVAAMNQCPCGRRDCTCSPELVSRYRLRVMDSGLAGLFDMRIDVPTLPALGSADKTQSESSSVIRRRVTAARCIQTARYEGWCSSKADESLLGQWSSLYPARVLRVSRTIADLEGSEDIELYHVKEAELYARR